MTYCIHQASQNKHINQSNSTNDHYVVTNCASFAQLKNKLKNEQDKNMVVQWRNKFKRSNSLGSYTELRRKDACL